MAFSWEHSPWPGGGAGWGALDERPPAPTGTHVGGEGRLRGRGGALGRGLGLCSDCVSRLCALGKGRDLAKPVSFSGSAPCSHACRQPVAQGSALGARERWRGPSSTRTLSPGDSPGLGRAGPAPSVRAGHLLIPALRPAWAPCPWRPCPPGWLGATLVLNRACHPLLAARSPFLWGGRASGQALRAADKPGVDEGLGQPQGRGRAARPGRRGSWTAPHGVLATKGWLRAAPRLGSLGILPPRPNLPRDTGAPAACRARARSLCTWLRRDAAWGDRSQSSPRGGGHRGSEAGQGESPAGLSVRARPPAPPGTQTRWESCEPPARRARGPFLPLGGAFCTRWA